jgi:hypothetical protein
MKNILTGNELNKFIHSIFVSWANVVKLYTPVSYEFSLEARMFAPGKPVQSSVFLVG